VHQASVKFPRLQTEPTGALMPPTFMAYATVLPAWTTQHLRKHKELLQHPTQLNLLKP